MPTVPIEQNRVGIADGATDAKLRPADYNVANDAIARGLQGLGAGVGQAAEAAVKIREADAETLAKDADNAFLAAIEQAKYGSDGQGGLFAEKGRNAVDAGPGAIEAISRQRKDISAGLKDRLAKKMFDRIAAQREADFTGDANRYVLGQHQQWQNDTSDARIKLNATAAIGQFMAPAKQADYLDAIASEVEAVGQRMGWSPETIASKRLEATSGVVVESTRRLADVNPDIAERYAKANGSLMTGAAQGDAADAVRIARARQEAEQRRLEAEARAAEAHQKADARERLATLKATLDTGAGNAADWEALATGYRNIGDTSAAVEAHAKGVEAKAAFAYRGAPLAQIDQRVAELASKPGLTVEQASELRGLRTLREQTAGRLNGPGGALAQYEFATGAVQPSLNFNDPASMRSRAQVAAAAAQQYGRATVEPLREAEIPALRDLATGDPKQQLRALKAISGFGDPKAIIGAAKQIAGQDGGGFRMAAALLSIPGVGEGMARDVLYGPDALKAAPKIWNEADGRLNFAQQTAVILRSVPPDYAADVFEAAKSLYATRWARAGHGEWNAQQFQVAIDTVLGAHRIDGVWFGGRGTINGAPVVIPPTMRPAEFAERFARAGTQAWRNASEAGTPRWPDKSPVYTGQLRQLVPTWLGGTRYGFLTRNGRLLGTDRGGPFVVDWAKLK